jgi:hypothetical protein
MVQTTFTRQKRELAKVNQWLERLRAHEVRIIKYSAEKEKQTETRESYVDYSPEEVASAVLNIVVEIVSQHGARQKANSKNTGRFKWQGIEADLTVPQLRALQNAQSVLAELVRKLPRRNPKLIPNTTFENHPAFQHPLKEVKEVRTRTIPYEEEASTRVRTYQENYEEIVQYTQTLEIDYGLDIKILNELNDLVTDLSTAIQAAIDEANAKGHEEDAGLTSLVSSIQKVFIEKLKVK